MWKLIEPKIQIQDKQKIFSDKMLIAMILPLFIEQFFIMLVGVADTLMISYAGEEAVSGVSLDNMFITIFLFVFTALASGGAVVISQYIGKKDFENGQSAAGKLFAIAGIVSFIAMILVSIFNEAILRTLFGSVEPAVMEACVTYLRITAYSFPAIAFYNAGSALYRSMGKTKPIMVISVLSNIINVIGNAIGIFVLKAGVAGVAWPSLIARTVAAIIMIYLCFNSKNEVYLKVKEIIHLEWAMFKRILQIAIPSSFEGGVFQMAKVGLGTITAMFGTSQIAANGIAQSFWSMAALIGVAMGPVFITVVGQTMGAQDPEAADYYMIRLLKMTYIASVTWNGLLILAVPLVMQFYDLAPETKTLVVLLVVIHNVFNAFIFPISSPFANGLRAAGDIRYTVMIAVTSTLVVRVLLSIVFGIWLNLGVIGIALAMVTDWSIRAVFYMKRFKGDRWKAFEVI